LDIDARSHSLFGRHESLRVFATISRLTKPQFTTGEVLALTGVASSQCSKELNRLKQLGLVRALSRRGDYERVQSAFWPLVDQILAEWESRP